MITQLIMKTLHVLSRFSPVPLFATLWTVAGQTPLSKGFSRQEHWSGLPCPPLTCPALADVFFTTSATWEALQYQLKDGKQVSYFMFH